MENPGQSAPPLSPPAWDAAPPPVAAPVVPFERIGVKPRHGFHAKVHAVGTFLLWVVVVLLWLGAAQASLVAMAELLRWFHADDEVAWLFAPLIALFVFVAVLGFMPVVWLRNRRRIAAGAPTLSMQAPALATSGLAAGLIGSGMLMPMPDLVVVASLLVLGLLLNTVLVPAMLLNVLRWWSLVDLPLGASRTRGRLATAGVLVALPVIAALVWPLLAVVWPLTAMVVDGASGNDARTERIRFDAEYPWEIHPRVELMLLAENVVYRGDTGQGLRPLWPFDRSQDDHSAVAVMPASFGAASSPDGRRDCINQLLADEDGDTGRPPYENFQRSFRRLGVNPTDAYDLTMSLVLRVCEREPLPEDPVRYAQGSIRNARIDQLREQARCTHHPGWVPERPDDQLSAADLIFIRQLRCSLTPEELELVDRVHAGATYAEIAAETGIGAPTLRQRYSRAMGRLREAYRSH